MAKSMKLTDILSSLDDTHEKLAEEEEKGEGDEEEETSKAKKDLLATLEDKEEKEEGEDEEEKSASPVTDLHKIAADLSAAEDEALVKEAHLYGSAVCDGFMARLAQYEEAAGHIGNEKTAADETDEDMEKLAALFQTVTEEEFAMADGFVKEAAEEGQQTSHEEVLVKLAEEAYQMGFNDTMVKTAQELYTQGFEDTLEQAYEMFKTAGENEAAEALEKAAFEAGYEDAMEKVAASAYAHGYEDMNNIIAKLS